MGLWSFKGASKRGKTPVLGAKTAYLGCFGAEICPVPVEALVPVAGAGQSIQPGPTVVGRVSKTGAIMPALHWPRIKTGHQPGWVRLLT